MCVGGCGLLFTCTIVHLTQLPLAMDKGSGDEHDPEIECVADPSLFWEVHSISRREKERWCEA